MSLPQIEIIDVNIMVTGELHVDVSVTESPYGTVYQDIILSPKLSKKQHIRRANGDLKLLDGTWISERNITSAIVPLLATEVVENDVESIIIRHITKWWENYKLAPHNYSKDNRSKQKHTQNDPKNYKSRVSKGPKQ